MAHPWKMASRRPLFETAIACAAILATSHLIVACDSSNRSSAPDASYDGLRHCTYEPDCHENEQCGDEFVFICHGGKWHCESGCTDPQPDCPTTYHPDLGTPCVFEGEICSGIDPSGCDGRVCNGATWVAAPRPFNCPDGAAELDAGVSTDADADADADASDVGDAGD